MDNQNLASWIFAAISLLYLAGMATYLIVSGRNDELPPAANFILGFLCAVASGFCAYFFTGTLGLKFAVPGTEVNGNAAGGIGVFVLVLLVWHRASPRHVAVTIRSDEALEAIDRILRDLEHVWQGVGAIEDGRVRQPSVVHRLSREAGAGTITFAAKRDLRPLQTLTAAEVREKLSPAERQLLIDTEEQMREKLKAWRREYARVGDPAAANIEQKKRLLRIASAMDSDLESIFGAIERTLNGELQDHYSAERWVASRAAGLLHQLELEEAGPPEREFGD